MQQQIRRPKVKYLIESNQTLRELKDLSLVVKFPAPNSPAVMQVTTYSDASFNTSCSQVHGQTGIIPCIERFNREGSNLFFPIDWASIKHRRVTNSSCRTEILAATDADDGSFYLNTILADLGSSFCLDDVLIEL